MHRDDDFPSRRSQSQIVIQPFSIKIPLPIMTPYLKQLLQERKKLDQIFLEGLGQVLESRKVLSSGQLSQTVALLVMMGQGKTKYREGEMKCVKQLVEEYQQGDGLIEGSAWKGQSSGWLSKIWDRLLHFSTFKHHVDILLLYFNVGDWLLQPEDEFKRLLSLLTQTIRKLKNHEDDTTIFAVKILLHFSRVFEKRQYSSEVRVKTKIMTLLLLAKTTRFTQYSKLMLAEVLEEVARKQLWVLMDSLHRFEDTPIFREEEAIWDNLFSSLLKLLNQSTGLSQQIRDFLVHMIRFKLDLQGVKVIVRQFEITGDEKPADRWGRIFDLLSIAMDIYSTTRTTLVFHSPKSFYRIPLQGRQLIVQVEVRTTMRTSREQRMLFAVEDKNKGKQLWVTLRNCDENEAVLIFLKAQNGKVTDKIQREVSWRQHDSNNFNFQIEIDSVTVGLKGQSQSNMTYHNFLQNVSGLVVGEESGMIGSAIKTLVGISITKDEAQLCCKLDLSIAGNHRMVRLRQAPSLAELIKAVGDLDIFLLIISHAVKKLKRQDGLIEMIRGAIGFLEKFVEVKQVHKVKLSQTERDVRLCAVLCLSWQSSHLNSSAVVILELLRVVQVRGITYAQDQLQLLCNFVFWKHFQWQYQKVIIMKMKELFSQLRLKDQSKDYSFKYCRRLLMETVLYYRLEDFALCEQAHKENLVKVHYEFFMMMEEQLTQAEQNNNQLTADFLEVGIKVLSWTINRRSTVIQAFDLTLAVQISILLRKAAEHAKTWLTQEEKGIKIIMSAHQATQIYDQQSCVYDEVPLKVFRKGSQDHFQEVDHSLIKEHLFFMSYHLCSLSTRILKKVLQLPQMLELKCIIWQKEFFDKMVLDKDHHLFEEKQEAMDRLAFIFNNLPLSALSNEQNLLLFEIYLSHHSFFRQASKPLSQHTWIKLGIPFVMKTIRSHIRSQKSPSSEILSQTHETSSIIFASPIKCQKILTLIGSCPDLTGQEGLILLEQLATINFSLKDMEQAQLLRHYFAVRGLADNTRGMMEDAPQSAFFLGTLMATEPRQVSSQIEGSALLSRDVMIAAMEYYLRYTQKRTISEVFGLTREEEAVLHVESIKQNLQQLLNLLGSCDPAHLAKLKHCYHFINKQLTRLARYNVKSINKRRDPGSPKSKSTAKKKESYIETPSCDLSEEAYKAYIEFIEERNTRFVKIEKVWSAIERKNKFFWSTFVGKQTFFSLFEGTGPLNQRYLLRKDTKRPKLELPVLHRGSALRSASVLSERISIQDDNESASSIFDDAPLYRKETGFCLGGEQVMAKQGPRSTRFSVLMITSAKIYQGTVGVIGKKLFFRQSEVINEEWYNKIYAANCERRTQDQCLKDSFYIEEELSSRSVAIVKRYLFQDTAVELHINNRSYLFFFHKKDPRLAFMLLLDKYCRVLTRDKLKEEVKLRCERWQNGLISNFEYLMALNDLTGRSLNDISQYYVFPWTVKTFNQPIDAEFFKDKDNFRDLTVPVGKLCSSKWSSIKSKFETTSQMKDTDIPIFLYGSFFSNRAIVSNFMIRVNPFASHHYQLQSQHFDVADRLFHSVENSWASLMQCQADFKELIPQFYYFPDFLTNRSAYNLGQKQNKDPVYDVILPSWAADSYEFVFRMRKILECQIVTQGLNSWIDLVLGVYTEKRYALRADNLFLGDLYSQGYEKYKQQKDSSLIQLFKEFGQVPIPVLKSNHPSSKLVHNYLDSLTHPSVFANETILHDTHKLGHILQAYHYKKFTVILFEKQLRLYEEQSLGAKSFAHVNGDFESGKVKGWQITDVSDKKHYCLMVHRAKSSDLLVFQIKKGIFGSYGLEGGQRLGLRHKIQQVAFYESHIVCSSGKNMYIYKNVKQSLQQDYSNHNSSLQMTINKQKYLLSGFTQFAQHRARITKITATERGIIISLDEQGMVHVLEIHGNTTEQLHHFQLRNTYFEEQIIQMVAHHMGMLLFRTNYHRLLVHTFMGDQLMAQHMQFPQDSPNNTEKVNHIVLWNQEMSEVLMSTTRGNLWKIDLFALRRKSMIQQDGLWVEKIYLNKEGFRKESLKGAAVKRIGRHWVIVALGQNHKAYTVCSEKWEEARKHELLGKKNVTFW